MEVIIPIIMAVIIDYGLESRSLGKVVLIGLAMIVAAMLALWFGVVLDLAWRSIAVL